MKISIHILFIFFLYIPYVTSEQRYTPVENVALDCGSRRNQAAEDDRRWTGDNADDARFVLIEDGSIEKSISASARSQASSVETVPYMTARISRSEFTYSFRVSVPGPKFLRLHFYPAEYNQALDVRGSFFNVKAGPFTLLKNFSTSLFANYMNQPAFMKEFCLPTGENERTINLTFVPASSASYAFVNAVEFVSMPDILYYAPEDDPSKLPPWIGQKTLGTYSDRALETLYRLNVGGRTIPPKEDTGMYREWSQVPVDYFTSKAVTPFNTSLPLKYTIIENYTAPDEVYQTALTMGIDAASNRARNMTWCLPVDRGFFYLVRLHFCQIQELIKGPYDMIFYLYIDKKTAESAVNVVSWTGGSGNGIPVYRDYVVYFRDEDNLSIAVHPRGEESFYDDAIVNGIEVFKMSNQGDKNLAGPNPGDTTRNPPSPTPEEPAGSKKRTVLIVSVAVCLGCLALFASFFVLFLRKKRHRKRKSSMRSTKGSSSLPEELCRHFLLWEIKSATREFDKKLIIGRGGFGDVYKGFIDGDESKPVAVKRLNRASKQGNVEFVTEINLLSKLRHVHLVSLIGYCDEDGEMILVYEYIVNGTLKEHLYGPNHEPLPWQTRIKVCIGAARGLQYLHNYAKENIIHRDVKTANILLDENWEAKVADFGMSKIGPSGGGAVSTMVKGTPGYLDPEYMRSEKLTDKTDVYSFGVVLFEVLCARKPFDSKLDETQWNLAEWARKCVRDGSVHEIIDPFLMGKIAPECFKKFVEVAESCVRDTGDRRPSMGDVREKLEFALELQEKADEVEQAKSLGADGVIYHPVVSFQADDDDPCDEFDLLGLRAGTGSRATVGSDSNAGVSFVSLETENRSDIFSENTSSSVSKV